MGDQLHGPTTGDDDSGAGPPASPDGAPLGPAGRGGTPPDTAMPDAPTPDRPTVGPSTTGDHPLAEIEAIEAQALRDRGLLLHPATLAAVGVTVLVLGVLAFLFSADDGDDRTDGDGSPEAVVDDESVEDGADEGDDSTPAADSGPAADGGAGGDAGDQRDEPNAASEGVPGEPGADDAVADPTAPPDDGPWVRATLDLDLGPTPGLVTLSGRVPSVELQQQLTAAAEIAYAPFVDVDVAVDESLPESTAIAASPAMIGLLPSITDGTILVTPDAVVVDGRTPDRVDIDRLTGVLAAIGGVEVDGTAINVTDLELAQFSAEASESGLTLGGVLPSEGVRDLIVAGATEVYGPDAISGTIEVDPGVTTSFWMMTMPGVLALLAQFDRYEFQVEDGVTSGTLQGGVGFAIDSTELTAEATQVLDVGVAIMARDPSLAMDVVGHTDAAGPDDLNVALSLARAESVVAYFVAAGIAPERLTASGAGEGEPIAANDTPDGRALNRRVEFQFGPAPQS